ncbi:MAG: outer membrane lipoprotein carrier protein LolA [Limnochordaceae bacterium]|nr:outer membrane lipoprotein carrier protein LolA [Limnochordaceae bacterium]
MSAWQRPHPWLRPHPPTFTHSPHGSSPRWTWMGLVFIFGLTLAFIAAGSAAMSLAAAATSASAPAAGNGSASSALAQLIETANRNLAKLEDLTASLEIVQYNQQTGEKVTLTASLQMILPDTLRLTYLTPDFVAGQIMVLQQDVNELRVYLPVTHQVMVQDLKKVMASHGVDIAVTLRNVISLPPQSLFTLSDEGPTSLTGGQLARVIRATPRQPVDSLGWEKIWVDPNSGFARQIQVYDPQGRLLYSIAVSNIKTNVGLAKAKVVALPKDAELVAAN